MMDKGFQFSTRKLMKREQMLEQMIQEQVLSDQSQLEQIVWGKNC
jgi:hypothetical protein